MKYMGGKFSIRKPLAIEIRKFLSRDQPFVDLFCGSCWVSVELNHSHTFCNDQHPYLMALWSALQQGWKPPSHVSKELYDYTKSHPDFNPPLTGFIGFSCSFGGKWWGGYARGNRNYALESKNSLLRKIEILKHASFTNYSYDQFPLPNERSVIYCDIPYKNTQEYMGTFFDHDQFYDWARGVAKDHTVLISEYAKNLPPNSTPVWQRVSKSYLAKEKSLPTNETLFLLT